MREYEEKKNKLLDTTADNDNALLIEDIAEKPKYNTASRKKIKLTGTIQSAASGHKE